jgi:hypothetical protein
VIVPELRRWVANMSVYRRPTPVVGLHIEDGNGAVPAQTGAMKKNRFMGGPRQVSLQLKASEPSLRRSVPPVGKPAVRPFVPGPGIGTAPAMPAAVAEPPVERTSEPELDLSALTEMPVEAVGPVVEQTASTPAEEASTSEAPRSDYFMPAPEMLAPVDWMTSAPSAPTFTEDQVVEAVEVPEPEARTAPPLEPEAPAAESTAWEPEAKVAETEEFVSETEELVSETQESAPETESLVSDTEPSVSEVEESAPENEPVGQGQPVPYQVAVAPDESEVVEAPPAPPLEKASIWPVEVATGASMSEIGTLRRTETPILEPEIVLTEPSFLQSTTTEIMPESTQMQTAPVIRTPVTGGTSQPASAMHTAVQLSFSFDIASMQLTPSFKMGALQLRPTSKIVTMRLAPAQQPQPAMNLQVTFEIAKIQPAGGGLGTVRLLPSQQQRPQIVGSPSFTVAGLQLVSNFEAAPVQLTPSQQAAVMVTAAFQIATVEFSPSFEIASIVLNSTSKQVAVQLAGTGTIESAPMFEIANLQLGPSGEIGMMQLNLGQVGRRG